MFNKSMALCIMVHAPSLSQSTTKCQHERYINSEYLCRKVSGIPRKVFSNRRLSIWTQAPYQDWFSDATTVRNINSSFDPLTATFFNDHFSWLIRRNSIIFLSCPAVSVRSPRNSGCHAYGPQPLPCTTSLSLRTTPGFLGYPSESNRNTLEEC